MATRIGPRRPSDIPTQSPNWFTWVWIAFAVVVVVLTILGLWYAV